jgi:septum site-determining protein MinC
MSGPSSFQLKGSLYTIPTLHLLSTDLPTLENELLKQITRTPHFFSNAPVVLDLSTLQQRNLTLDFKGLVKIMREFSLIPVGVKGGSEEQNKAANAAGLGTFPEHKTVETAPEPSTMTTAAPASKKETNQQRRTMVIIEQVRSGTQIYAKDSDLIILASVSPGAEVLADGNIHIYGTLRGRALAGAMGDTQARIFCKELDAELVSIAGNYKLNEELSLTKKSSGMTQIQLENDALQFAEV